MRLLEEVVAPGGARADRARHGRIPSAGRRCARRPRSRVSSQTADLLDQAVTRPATRSTTASPPVAGNARSGSHRRLGSAVARSTPQLIGAITGAGREDPTRATGRHQMGKVARWRRRRSHAAIKPLAGGTYDDAARSDRRSTTVRCCGACSRTASNAGLSANLNAVPEWEASARSDPPCRTQNTVAGSGRASSSPADPLPRRRTDAARRFRGDNRSRLPSFCPATGAEASLLEAMSVTSPANARRPATFRLLRFLELSASR